MAAHEYVWFLWSLAFLAPWLGLYAAFRTERRTMLLTSLFTAPLGLTEPIFVPTYWSPPSLFDLARRTGFDIESIIFCFAIGGVAAVLYNALAGARLRPVGYPERHRPLHRHHYLALAAPFVSFPLLYALPWNPIYAAIAALAVGGLATIWCRPDLKRKTWIGAALFLVYYAAFFVGLAWLWPDYVEHVWNLAALSGIIVAGIPLEELLFAASFGLYWAGAYEHFTWTGIAREERSTLRVAKTAMTALGFLVSLPLVPPPAFAATSETYKVADGVAVYLGVLPAEMIRGHAPSHPETTMHGGRPKSAHVHHVLVAVFDAKNGTRIEDAVVTARVIPAGLAGEEKPFEVMDIADTVTYGNYFAFSQQGPYRIRVEIRRPAPAKVATVEFTYDHR